MSASLVLTHLAIAVVAIVLLIVWVRLNPIIVLVLGALYLGLATGTGFEQTVDAVTTGFGDLMAEVGLIIGFGVLIGTLLYELGALHRTVELLLRLVGARGAAQALGNVLAVVFPSIYFDVALVMVAPIARSIARRSGRSIAGLGGALAIGLEVGLLMVLPGAAALAVAGAVGVPLGLMLLFGLLIGVPSTVLSIWLHTLVMRRVWHPAVDEDESAQDTEDDAPDARGGSSDSGPPTPDGPGTDTRGAEPSPVGPAAATSTTRGATVLTTSPTSSAAGPRTPLVLLLCPVLLPLALILVGTVNDAAGWGVGVLGFLSSPTVALLLGLIVGVVLALRTMTRDDLERVLTRGANNSGVLLLFTGVAGSLGEVISSTGVRDIVAALFDASSLSPLILVWVVAAALRLAQGSGSVAAITAAGLISTVSADLGVGTATLALVALAAAAGAAFGGHVSDNSFWMFRSLLGLTTRGTFKVYTLAQSMLSLVALGLTLLVGVFV